MNCLCEFFEGYDFLEDGFCDLESIINVGSKMKNKNSMIGHHYIKTYLYYKNHLNK